MRADTFRVSSSGQMSLPAAVRRRWHLDEGGPVDVIDLGFGVLTLPAGDADCSTRCCPPTRTTTPSPQRSRPEAGCSCPLAMTVPPSADAARASASATTLSLADTNRAGQTLIRARATQSRSDAEDCE